MWKNVKKNVAKLKMTIAKDGDVNKVIETGDELNKQQEKCYPKGLATGSDRRRVAVRCGLQLCKYHTHRYTDTQATRYTNQHIRV